MDSAALEALGKWMKSTDIKEIVWHSGGKKLSLKAACEAKVYSPRTLLYAVSAPAIGIFRFSLPGRSADIKEGMAISKGERLGFIEIGEKREPVISEYSGILKIIAISDGQAAEYGKPLFFLESNAE